MVEIICSDFVKEVDVIIEDAAIADPEASGLLPFYMPASAIDKKEMNPDSTHKK